MKERLYPDKPIKSHAEIKAEVDKHVEEYLARGGKVEQVPILDRLDELKKKFELTKTRGKKK